MLAISLFAIHAELDLLLRFTFPVRAIRFIANLGRQFHIAIAIK